jgi:hypothetical protein
MTTEMIILDGYDVALGEVQVHGVTTMVNEDTLKIWEIHSASKFPDCLGLVDDDLNVSGNNAQVKIYLNVNSNTENGDDKRVHEKTIVSLPLHDQKDGWNVIAGVEKSSIRVAAYKS